MQRPMGLAARRLAGAALSRAVGSRARLVRQRVGALRQPVRPSTRPRSACGERRAFGATVATSRRPPDRSPSPETKTTSLVIFDKDGTLICFNSMWSPWALDTAQRLEVASGLKAVDIAQEVYRLLGFCPQTSTVQPGLLAEATMPQIRAKLVQLLVIHGLELIDAEEVVDSIWVNCDTSSPTTLRSLHNLRQLFETLHAHNIKVAVCTADAREGTEGAIAQLGLEDLIDIVVCGDDVGTQPKPSPHNALKICRALGVDPEEALMVGDTLADMNMGRSAQLGGTIGVLSGVASATELAPHADHVVQHVGELLPILLRRQRRVAAGKRRAAATAADSETHKLQAYLNDRFGGSQTAEADLIKHIRTNFRPSWLRKESPWDGRMRRKLHTASRAQWRDVGARHYATGLPPADKKPTHIVVGAGSAGCVIASRLSEDPSNRVVLFETGPPDDWWRWKIHMPAALMYNLCNDNYNWFYHTLAQKHMDERVMYWPRGRVWGGSSALNAMAYVRGHPDDYDRWESEGAVGWAYKHCLPYFKKAQSHELATAGDLFRGADGPLRVTQGKGDNPLHRAFVAAGEQAGFGYTADMNGCRQEGVGPMDMTISGGKRWSASQAYLRPALHRPNLFVARGFVFGVVFDRDRAVGVEYIGDRDAWTDRLDSAVRQKLYAQSDIILCGGAINTPQLLLLSGVGPADHISAHHIPVKHHLAGVGRNMQDHLEVYVQQECTKPVTLYDKSSWKFPHTMIRVGLQWFARRTGEAASSHLETGGFVRSQPDATHPDVQLHFLPSTVHDHGRKGGDRHAYQVHVGSMRPESRGFVKLQTTDPRTHPLLQPNYLATERDRREMRDCVRVARRIFEQPAFDEFRGAELLPGAAVADDDALDKFVRDHADSAYHPSCTCKMGRSDDAMAVVDGQTMGVHGLRGLRIVDASVMPSVVSGNLNAPTIMLAEKAADLIAGRSPLPPEQPDIWRPPPAAADASPSTA